jgi:hypothetical protein
MAITDLTGTTWEFNQTINTGSSSTFITYALQFSSNSTNYTELARNPGKNAESALFYYVDSSKYDRVYDDGWSNTAYKTIHITSGTDVTNANLISWLEANAVQVQDVVLYTTTVEELTSIANAIRSKTGSQATIEYPDGFITEISNL